MSQITVRKLHPSDPQRGKFVTVSLDIDGEDSEFGSIVVVVPCLLDEKISRPQVHKALAKEFRRILDEEYQDEKFLVNECTAVFTLDSPEGEMYK